MLYNTYKRFSLIFSMPSLWILSNNDGANAFYKKKGFVESGKKKQLRNDLFEVELVLYSER